MRRTLAYSYAAKAAEFGAVWAETSIPQFLHADEAAKHLGDALHRDAQERLIGFTGNMLFCTAALYKRGKNFKI